MLGHQGVALFERMRGVGLVGGNMSLGLGVEVSKANCKPGISIYLHPADLDVGLSAPSPAQCLSACCLPP